MMRAARGIVVAALCFTWFPACDAASIQEIHLIPHGYTGEVFIVYNVPDGEPLESEGSWRVYRIPANGILRLQDKLDYGPRAPTKYYYASPGGERARIEGFWPDSMHDTGENRSDPTVGVFFPRTGQIQPEGVLCTVTYRMYFVGTKALLLSRSAGSPDELRFREYLKENDVCPD